MTQPDPAELVGRIRTEVAELSGQLVRLAGDLQSLSSSLGAQPWAAGQATPGPVAAPAAPAPTAPAPAVPAAGGPYPGMPPSPTQLPPGWIQFPQAPVVAGPMPQQVPYPPQQVPYPPQQLPYPPQAAPGQAPAAPPVGWPTPRPAAPQLRRLDLAEIFSIVGSAVTLIGVALVLMLPQDGLLGPLGRTALGLGLAAAAVAAAVWQHRVDAKNIGAQALLATGVASAFLVVLALTVVFRGPTGQPMVSMAPGLVLAGLVSVGGLLMARRWSSEWLAVLAILGSLLLAPFIGENRIWIVAFMGVMTIGAGLLQRGLGWVGLVVARSVPTGVYFLGVATLADYGRSAGDTAPMVAVVLATTLALASLGLAVLHQTAGLPERVAGVASMVLLTAPVILTAHQAGQWPGTVACLVVGVAFTVVGALSGLVDRLIRASAIPIGALHLAYGVLLATDGRFQGYLFWGLALAYLAVAERSGWRPVLVVGTILAAVGAVHWVPQLDILFNPGAVERYAPDGIERVVESVLGVAVAVMLYRAFRALFPDRRTVLGYGAWALAVVAGTVGVVLTGGLVGRASGDVATGFQVAHAVVTVTWMALCVLLLARGLRADADAAGSVGLATALAAAAVLKLFLFDLATLPGLARALAFLAVGVLLLVVGTWYHRQLSRVRRRTSSGPGEPPPLS